MFLFVIFFFSASCGIPFQVLPDYQEGAEQVRNWNKNNLCEEYATAKQKTKKSYTYFH